MLANFRKLVDFRKLAVRALESELMDDFSQGGVELAEAHRHLRRLNKLFGAARPVCRGLDRLWKEVGKPERWTIMDVGCGAGELNRTVFRWARRRGVRLSLILVDKSEEACEEAGRLFGGDERVQIWRDDLFGLPESCVDVVTASQFAHHFSEEELIAVVRRMSALARVGVVLADIHRHWLAWAAVSLATRMVSGNRYIRHDGPLSVAKGFQDDDWGKLGRSLPSCQLTYEWIALFRYVVTITPSKRGE